MQENSLAPSAAPDNVPEPKQEYGTTNALLIGTLSGLQNGDDITAIYVTTADLTSPVGQYEITPVMNDPSAKLGNYAVTLANGILTVTPAFLNGVVPIRTEFMALRIPFSM